MANNTGTVAGGIRGNGTIVTPGTLVYNPPLSSLYVGGAGNITLTMSNSGTVTLTAVPVGTFINDLSIVNVGTATATNLVGFF